MRPKRPCLLTYLPFAGAWLVPALVYSADIPTASCGAERPLVIPLADPSAQKQDIQISAGRTTAEGGDLYILEDNVKLEQGARALYSDQMIYNKQSDQADAEGRVRYEQPGMLLQGSRARFNLGGNQAQIENAQYSLGDHQMRGTAERIEIENNIVTLEQATYTTCQPGQDHWLLSASHLHLDNDSHTGTARNVTLEIFSIPMLYFPYINFSLGPRKSGFLLPSFANSSRTGFEFAQPYYFNLAPDRDATVSPRYMTKRGIQLNGEFRYLNPANRGSLYTEWLPNDTQTEQARTLFSWEHKQQFAAHLEGQLQFAQVSDGAYFHDLGSNLTTSSQSYLERRGRLGYNSEQLSVSALAQSFQTLDSQLAHPYQRLPQIAAAWRTGWGSMRADFPADFTYFYRNGQDHVQRAHLAPRLYANWRKEFGYITPSATMRATRYHTATGEQIDRIVPTASLNMGLFFDRDEPTQRHTLEPQVFYTYTPFRNQNTLPVIDSAIPESTLAQLTREDRYTGTDRIGDQQRLVGALTYRNFSRSRGVEEWIASSAILLHVDDENVVIPGEISAKAGTYDILTSLDTRVGKAWSTHGDTYLPANLNRPSKGSALLKYASSSGAMELGYRYRHSQWELVQGSLGWRPRQRWRLAVRANYSLAEQRVVETAAGFEYSDCCWGVSMIMRRYVGAGNDVTTTVGLQFELKGLSSVGSRLDQGLARDLFTF